MEGREGQQEAPNESGPRRDQRQEIDELKRLLAEKTLEVDFFKGALQKIAARRRNNSKSGEKAFYDQIRELMPMQRVGQFNSHVWLMRSLKLKVGLRALTSLTQEMGSKCSRGL
jgi:hypothetical protein